MGAPALLARRRARGSGGGRTSVRACGCDVDRLAPRAGVADRQQRCPVPLRSTTPPRWHGQWTRAARFAAARSNAQLAPLWLATDAGLHVVSVVAGSLTTSRLDRPELGDVRVVGHDATADRVFAGAGRRLFALDGTGERVGEASLDDQFARVAGAPLHLVPRVSVVQPPDGTSLGEARPAIELRLEAICNGSPCELPREYLGGARLFAALDDRTMSDAFRFDPVRGIAAALPTGDLVPGENRFTAHAVDAFDHASLPIDAVWTRLDPIRLLAATKAPNQRPTVTLTSPIDGARFVPGSSITLSATATDTDGTVAKVDFYRDGSIVGTDTASPYSVVWGGVAAGTYALTARATDNKGAATTSATVTIVVAPPVNIPPAIAMTNPPNGAAYAAGSSVDIAASASDADGTISRVDFYDGSALLGSVTGGASSLAASWTVDGIAPGAHALTVVAVDNAGASASAGVIAESRCVPPRWSS